MGGTCKAYAEVLKQNIEYNCLALEDLSSGGILHEFCCAYIFLLFVLQFMYISIPEY